MARVKKNRRSVNQRLQEYAKRAGDEQKLDVIMNLPGRERFLTRPTKREVSDGKMGIRRR